MINHMMERRYQIYITKKINIDDLNNIKERLFIILNDDLSKNVIDTETKIYLKFIIPKISSEVISQLEIIQIFKDFKNKITEYQFSNSPVLLIDKKYENIPKKEDFPYNTFIYVNEKEKYNNYNTIFYLKTNISNLYSNFISLLENNICNIEFSLDDYNPQTEKDKMKLTNILIDISEYILLNNLNSKVFIFPMRFDLKTSIYEYENIFEYTNSKNMLLNTISYIDYSGKIYKILNSFGKSTISSKWTYPTIYIGSFSEKEIYFLKINEEIDLAFIWYTTKKYTDRKTIIDEKIIFNILKTVNHASGIFNFYKDFIKF